MHIIDFQNKYFNGNLIIKILKKISNITLQYDHK